VQEGAESEMFFFHDMYDAGMTSHITRYPGALSISKLYASQPCHG
jgi:hypothetical protein